MSTNLCNKPRIITSPLMSELKFMAAVIVWGRQWKVSLTWGLTSLVCRSVAPPSAHGKNGAMVCHPVHWYKLVYSLVYNHIVYITGYTRTSTVPFWFSSRTSRAWYTNTSDPVYFVRHCNIHNPVTSDEEFSSQTNVFQSSKRFHSHFVWSLIILIDPLFCLIRCSISLNNPSTSKASSSAQSQCRGCVQQGGVVQRLPLVGLGGEFGDTVPRGNRRTIQREKGKGRRGEGRFLWCTGRTGGDRRWRGHCGGGGGGDGRRGGVGREKGLSQEIAAGAALRGRQKMQRGGERLTRRKGGGALRWRWGVTWEEEFTGGLARRDSRRTVQIGHHLRDKQEKVTGAETDEALNTHVCVVTLDGDDSEGADSGRLRGGTGGGTQFSSQPWLKVTMEETEEDPVTTTNTTIHHSLSFELH